VPDYFWQIPDDGTESDFCTEEEFTVIGLGSADSVPLYANDVTFDYLVFLVLLAACQVINLYFAISSCREP
jgi:hypothetical protein